MGIRACPATELIFDGAEVPVANRLGAEGEGYKIALSALAEGRISIAAACVGIARAGLEAAAAYVQQRKAFGAPLAEQQGLRFMLAEMAREVAAARAVTHEAAAAKDRGEPLAEVSSIAKWTASDAAMRVATDAVQLFGASGYSRETGVERLMRDAKGAQIYEGTNQIHRLIVADGVLRSARCRFEGMTQPTTGPNGHVYIVSAARTPIGKFGGALSAVPAVELGGVAIRAAVERAGLDPATARIDDVLMGQVLQAGVGQAPARQATLRAGLPDTTSATTINRVCGSGLKAIMLAAAEIRAGDAEVVVAGGMESMNGAPYLLPGARFGYRLGNGELIDATVHDGLWCAIEDCHMGTHAERVAIKDHVEPRGPGRLRAGQPPEGDRGHRRRPVRRRDGAGHRPRREGPRDRRQRGRRPASRLDAPRRWRGSSRPSTCPTARTAATPPIGTVTAGNAPGITDGAAATVVASRARGRAARPDAARPDRRLRPGRGRARSGSSSRRSRASAACSTGSRCRSRRST